MTDAIPPMTLSPYRTWANPTGRGTLHSGYAPSATTPGANEAALFNREVMNPNNDMFTQLRSWAQRLGITDPYSFVSKYSGYSNPLTMTDYRPMLAATMNNLEAGRIPGYSQAYTQANQQMHTTPPPPAGAPNWGGGSAPPPPPIGSRGGVTVTPITQQPPAVVGPRTGGTPTPPIDTSGRGGVSTPGLPVIGTGTRDNAGSTGTGTTPPVDFGRLFNPTGYDGTDVGQMPSVSSDSLSAQPAAAPGQVDYSHLFNPTGYDGTTVGYDAADYLSPTSTAPTGGITGPSTVFPINPGSTPMPSTTFPTNTSGGPTTMPGGFPTGAQTLGQDMYPWLTSYQGNFAAPMTPYENQGLNAISQFVSGGEGLGGAQGYLANVLSGQYLDPSTNPNLAKYISSLSGIHDYQDNLERQRIGSSMAAGGNALSGARAMAESEYQNQSNNQYQNMIAQMLNSDYLTERGYQNSAIPMQMGIANELMGGYNNLMGAGAVPRSIQNQQNQAEYQDWLRQITGMQQAFQQPENTMLSLLHAGYPGSHQQGYQDSAASSWLAALLGNGSGSSGLLNALFGSNTTGGSSGGLLGALGSLFGGGGGSTDPNAGSLNDPNNPYGSNYGGGVSTGQNYGPNAGTYGYDPYANDPLFDPSNYGTGLNDAEWAQLLDAFGYSNQGNG